MQLTRVFLNTGYTDTLDLPATVPEADRLVVPMLRPGIMQEIPFAEGYTVEWRWNRWGGLLGEVCRFPKWPMLHFELAPDAEAADLMWPSLEQLYLRNGDAWAASDMPLPCEWTAVPEKPADAPWLAEIALPGWLIDEHETGRCESLDQDTAERLHLAALSIAVAALLGLAG